MKLLLARYCLFTFLSAAALPALASNEASPRSIALQAVDALMVQHDPEAFKQYVDPDAERKNDGAGSLLKSLERQPAVIFSNVELDRVIFFTAESVDSLAAEYPDDLWDRLRERLGDRMGCLSVVKVKGHDKVGMMAFIVETADETPRIVYSDDN